MFEEFMYISGGTRAFLVEICLNPCTLNIFKYLYTPEKEFQVHLCFESMMH